MLDIWIGLPIVLRLVILALTGLMGGALANYLIYTWCYFPRAINPWTPPSAGAPPRRPSDRVPIIGWLGLRREASLHGRGFWIRPILIELGLAVGLPALYWFETQSGGLLPLSEIIPATLEAFEPWGTQIFLGHALLLILMTAATFIDFDEQTIPDIITIPGTIVALIIASITQMGFMPADVFIPAPLKDGFMPAPSKDGLTPTIFNIPWMEDPAVWRSTTGLWTGLAIWSGWCFALADRRLILRRGLTKAVAFFFAGLVRYPTWKLLVAIWIAGILAISFVWNLGGANWLGLFSSLIGLAVGGGVVWAIRIVASSAMGVEAMGFGDVTLMAMIGAFIGWQAAVLAFFLSPVAAIVIVIIQFIVTREPRVPFGPYLCAGTLLTIIGWDRLFNGWLSPQLALLGSFILWLCLTMLGLMGVMLFIWRHIKQAVFR